MDIQVVLKVLSDINRYKIIKMLLAKDYCVRAISRRLHITESAVSQHIKVLKSVGLLTGRKSGYYMHYDVNKDMLIELSSEIAALASIERENNSYLDCECKNKKKCVGGNVL